MLDKVEVAEKIELIRQRFLYKLQQEIQQIIAFQESLISGNISEKEQQDVLFKMHKISGSAKLFGFAELGGCAAVIEEILEDEILDGNRDFLIANIRSFIKESQQIISARLNR